MQHNHAYVYDGCTYMAPIATHPGINSISILNPTDLHISTSIATDSGACKLHTDTSCIAPNTSQQSSHRATVALAVAWTQADMLLL